MNQPISDLAKKAARLIRAKTAGAIAPGIMFEELDNLIPPGAERDVLRSLHSDAYIELIEVYRERSITRDRYDYRSHIAACELGIEKEALNRRHEEGA